MSQNSPDPIRLFVYVQCQVTAADPDRVNLLNGLVEKTTGQAQPDVVPHADPGSISFADVLIEAYDADTAYDEGHKALEATGHKRQPNSAMNDYVIDLTALGLQRIKH